MDEDLYQSIWREHVSWSPGLVAAVEAEVEPGVEDEVQPTLVTPVRPKAKARTLAQPPGSKTGKSKGKGHPQGPRLAHARLDRPSGDRGKRKRHEVAGASNKKPAMSSASVAVGVGGIEKS